MRTYCNRKANRGFTLIEIIVAVGLLSVLMVGLGPVLITSMNALRVEESFASLNASMRSAAARLASELSVATLEGVNSASPPVEGLVLSGNPPDSVTFQKPLSLDGSTWTGPLTIRLRNEDGNGNLTLDPGEDENANGVLDRVIERVEDLDGDGEFTSEGETMVLATDVDSMWFGLNGSRLDVTFTITIRADPRAEEPMRQTIGLTIQIAN